MKVALVYPAFKKDGQYPLLSQNRQFRFSNSLEIRIFPLIMGSAATMLKKAGHEVLFLDAVNERLTPFEYETRLRQFSPDLILLETKAPVVKLFWKHINYLKENLKSKVAICGDHVSYFPKETFDNSKVDYVLVGGDYDSGIVKLADSIKGNNKKFSPGIWYRNSGKVVDNGFLPDIKNLDEIPFIDRRLTNWHNYGEAYLRKPSMYILSGRGCGGGDYGPGKCTFCIWQHAFWRCRARLRSPENFVAELRELYKTYRIREVFDDNEGGGVWDKAWLEGVYREMNKHGLLGKIWISSNARADSLNRETCRLMKRIGYRLLKIGLESGNNKTLQKLNKGETIEQIKAGIKAAKRHGMVVLMTTMVGFPWEDENDVRRTYEVTKELMLYRTKVGDSLQSSVIMPYPGTPLYRLAEREGWLIYGAKDYEKLDQTKAILKSPIDTQKWCKKIWAIHTNPLFVFKTMVSIRNKNDLELITRGVRSVLGHLKDY